jgi:hypothetical protein
MPDTPGVDLDQYNKEKEEFSDAMDEVFSEENEGKSDEEIIKDMDDKATKPDKDGEGISQKGPVEVVVETPTTKDLDDSPPDDGQAPVVEELVTKPAEDVVVTDPVEQVELLTAELAKERQKTSSWAGRISAANTKVKELEIRITELVSAATTVEDKSVTESDNAVIDRFRGDFPEMGDVLDIMQKRIDGKQVATPVKVVPEPAKATANADNPAGEAAADNKGDHLTAIHKIHPDLPEMVSTGVLLTWINEQPDYIRPTLEAIYRNGVAEKVIQMVTNFKSNTGWKSQLDTAGKTAADSTAGKLKSMVAVTSTGSGPPKDAPDKNDYKQAAKDAGL